MLFITQLGLAFVARAAPAMQIFNVGFAVTLAVGGFVLVFVLPDIADELGAEFSHVGVRFERLLDAFGGVAP